MADVPKNAYLYNIMTLQQLEYVLTVDRFRHFAKAAEYCCVTQPTLSAMIQKLEDELGVKIFDRSRQPIVPTHIGKLVIDRARVVLEQAGRIKEVIEEERKSVNGVFRLGILPTIAPYLLPRFFPQMMRKYPQLDIRVVEMKTSDVQRDLNNGRIDAGIVAAVSGMEGLVSTELFYDRFFAYVAREDALSGHSVIKTSDLNDKQLWLLDEGHCFRDQLVRFCHLKSAQQSQTAYCLGSMETFMRMVESGKGITFIPELSLLQLDERQRELVRPFAIPVPTRKIVMVTSRDFIRHTLLETIAQEIRLSVPHEMLSLSGTQKVV